MKSLSFRIPGELGDRVAEWTRSWRQSDSEVYRQIIDEWVRLQGHPGIRFADGPAGRRAALVGGPDIWEIVDVARDYDFDHEAVQEDYPWLTADQLTAANRYYEAFPDEIDARIEDNLRVAEELGRELALVVRERQGTDSREGETGGSSGGGHARS